MTPHMTAVAAATTLEAALAAIPLLPRGSLARYPARFRPAALPPGHVATGTRSSSGTSGQVVRIDVVAGDIVEDGQTLAIVEAMKMENVLKAEKRARVKAVRVKAGAVLAVDEVILEFEGV